MRPLSRYFSKPVARSTLAPRPAIVGCVGVTVRPPHRADRRTGQVGRLFSCFRDGLRIAIVTLFSLLPVYFASAQPQSICPEHLTVDVDGTLLKIPYCTNAALSHPNEQLTRALVVVHGNNRNADDYFGYVERAGEIAGDKSAATGVFAPQFLVESDIERFSMTSDMLYWSGGWKQGHKSLDTASNPRPQRVSSFGVVDRLIAEIVSTHGNVATITIAGHSAGGQFVNRYASGSGIQETFPALKFRFVVANPSSYLYFSDERVVPGSVTEFRTPETNCKTYNDYKYGLVDLNSYMRAAGERTLAPRYAASKVVYLYGELDNNPSSSSLDTSCAANLQGVQRLERGTVYYNYLTHFFGEGIEANHVKDIVPGVGHDAKRMFQSACGVFGLYDVVTPGASCSAFAFAAPSLPLNVRIEGP